MRRYDKRARATGRGKSASFVQLPHDLLRDSKFQALSPNACKALLFLVTQYTGYNNGDFGIAWKIAKDKGWTSKGALHAAVEELCEAGFAMLTRQGGRNRCSLYAVTWFSIDECAGKLDVAATRVAPRSWRPIGNLSGPRTVQFAPSTVQSGPEP